MLKLADRVKETSITTGNSLKIVLQGAFGAFQTFASTIGDGNSTYYTIENNNNFEVGLGTYSASDNTLSRDLVFSSTNNNQRISLDGVSIVFCCYPASKAVVSDDSRLYNDRHPIAHTHQISDIESLQNILDSKQPSGSYASTSHLHTSVDITDFASAVITYAPPTTDASLLSSGILSDSRLSDNIVRTTDARLSDARTPLSHNHNISDITGLQLSLDSKQPSGSYAAFTHTHAIASISGLQSALDNKQPSGNYASLSHNHAASNIIDFNSTVNSLVSGIYAPLVSPVLTGVPLAPTASSGTNTNQIASTSFVRTEISNLVGSAPSTLDTLNELATALGNDPNFATTISNILSNKAALSGASFTGSISSPSGSFTSLKVNNTNVSLSGHTHPISDIINLQSSLDSKQPSGSYASLNHTHLIIDVSGLQAVLDSKQSSGSYASLVHNHLISDVSGLQSILDGKQPSGSYAALSHNHLIADVSGLQTALDGKQPSGSYAPSSHTHSGNDIIDGTISNNKLSGNAQATINLYLWANFR